MADSYAQGDLTFDTIRQHAAQKWTTFHPSHSLCLHICIHDFIFTYNLSVPWGVGQDPPGAALPMYTRITMGPPRGGKHRIRTSSLGKTFRKRTSTATNDNKTYFTGICPPRRVSILRLRDLEGLTPRLCLPAPPCFYGGGAHAGVPHIFTFFFQKEGHM
jgi:hypothetical protein